VNILNTDVTAGGLPPAFLGNTECGCRISRPRSSVGVFSSTPKPTRLGRSGSPLDKNAATFTFVTSGDLKADLLTIDLLLKEAGVGVTVGEAVVVTGTRTWQQEHARMMRAYRRAVSANGIKHLRADRRARVDPDSRISAVQSALQTGAFQKHTYQTHERALSSLRAEAISTLAKLQALASRRGQPSCASTS
jgi:hypothetical protein